MYWILLQKVLSTQDSYKTIFRLKNSKVVILNIANVKSLVLVLFYFAPLTSEIVYVTIAAIHRQILCTATSYYCYKASLHEAIQPPPPSLTSSAPALTPDLKQSSTSTFVDSSFPRSVTYTVICLCFQLRIHLHNHGHHHSVAKYRYLWAWE